MNGYFWLKQELGKLFEMGAKIGVIGKSVCRRKIYAIEIGSGDPVILQYGIHAREYVTCSLAILHAKMLLKKKTKNIKFVLVPMANPDGTEIAFRGKSACANNWAVFDNCDEKELLLWKANARGVDLNNNFDANHGTNIHSKVPSSHGYPGKFPESEPETRALVKLTKILMPKLTISFHTKGEEIYFDFFQSDHKLKRDKKIANLFAKSFGYKVVSTQNSSSGGYKDWCVSKLGIASLTIELASDKKNHPIKTEEAEKLLRKTKYLDKLCTKAIKIIDKTSAT